MKILVCVSEYPPYASGIGNVAYRMVREFEKRGHTCTVCSPTGPDIMLGSYKLIQRFGGFGLLHFWWCVQRYFTGKAAEWDTVWLHWPMFMAQSPFPRAVATFHGTYRGFRDMARGMRSRLFLKWYYSFMEFAERRYLRTMNHSNYLLVAVSSGTAIELHSHGISADRITYISVGVDTERFRPVLNKPQLRVELGIPVEAVVMLYVGRLTHPKNLFRLVDVFAEVRRQLRHVMLLMVGNGELEKPLSQYVEENKVPDVKLLGFIPNDELPRIYGCGDFFIMASTYEGQPVALLEAMASGLPPIVSNIPVMEQLVKESGAGIMVDFSHPAEAARQIEAYVLSPKAQNDHSYVRQRIETAMSSSVCAERYLALLEQARWTGTSPCTVLGKE